MTHGQTLALLELKSKLINRSKRKTRETSLSDPVQDSFRNKLTALEWQNVLLIPVCHRQAYRKHYLYIPAVSGSYVVITWGQGHGCQHKGDGGWGCLLRLRNLLMTAEFLTKFWEVSSSPSSGCCTDDEQSDNLFNFNKCWFTQGVKVGECLGVHKSHGKIIIWYDELKPAAAHCYFVSKCLSSLDSNDCLFISLLQCNYMLFDHRFEEQN